MKTKSILRIFFIIIGCIAAMFLVVSADSTTRWRDSVPELPAETTGQSVIEEVPAPETTAPAPQTTAEETTEPVTEPPHEHTYVFVSTKEPTCTERGYDYSVCDGCGEEMYSAFVGALGHTFSDWQTTLEPTTETVGKEERLCAVCELTQTRTLQRLPSPPDSYIGDVLGITRTDVVNWLSSHENDRYYFGTPYKYGPFSAPLGDPNCALVRSAPSPQMSCAGFVAHALYKSGMNPAKFNEYLKAYHPDKFARQGFNVCSADMWYLFVTGDEWGYGWRVGSFNFYAYRYQSLEAALASGHFRKGDLYLTWPKDGYEMDGKREGSSDSHIGFFWGDSPDEDKCWDCTLYGVRISNITLWTPNSDIFIIPISAE